MDIKRTRELTFMGLYVALYIVLWYAGQFIPLLKMPQGGAIEIELAALFVASFHLGWKKGLAVSLLSILVQVMLGGANWFLNPMQYALDYIVPFSMPGIAALFSKGKYRYYIGVVIAMVLKYISQVISGAYFWPPEGGAAGSAEAWTVALTYNLWFNLATCVVCIILVPLLLDRLKAVHLIDEGQAA